MTLTVGSLFSGIGGLDLGLERAGMQVIWQSEIDPYACRVLAKHWPEVPNYGDIKRINFADVVRPDVICGGYPCQPFSTAGKRQGEEDPRHLWPWVREALRILRPRYAILENVRGHLSLGGSTVLSEIAALGYSAEWRVISAASVGANHRRDRIFIVAYPNGSSEADGRQRKDLSSEDRSGRDDRGGSDSDPREITLRSAGQDLGDVADSDDARSGTSRRNLERKRTSSIERRQELAQFGSGGCDTDVADADSNGLQEERRTRGLPATLARAGSDGSTMAVSEVFGSQSCKDLADRENALSGYCASGSDSSSRPIYSWWETEPDVGRVANGIPNRVDRLKGLGNAVVPQVAEVIGRLVIAHNERQPR